jgi:hypothetical protein
VPDGAVRAARKHGVFLKAVMLEHNELFSQTVLGMFDLNHEPLWRWG